MDSFTLLPVVKNFNNKNNLRNVDDKTEISVSKWLLEDLCLNLGKIFKNNTCNLDELLHFLKTYVKVKVRLSTSYYSEIHFEKEKRAEKEIDPLWEIFYFEDFI